MNDKPDSTVIQPMESAPKDGRFIDLHRSNGTVVRAHWGQMPWSLFRDPDADHWLTERGKFATVPFAEAVGWMP